MQATPAEAAPPAGAPDQEGLNVPSPERLERLDSLLGPVDVYFWAAAHTCDVGKLDTLIRMAELSPEAVSVLAGGVLPIMISPWVQNRGDVTGEPSLVRQFKTARWNAFERDGRRCILTKMRCPEIASIYPFHLLKKQATPWGARSSFWKALAIFWPPSQITTWKDELFHNGHDEDGRETAANFIALTAACHFLWLRGDFAFKPISLSEHRKTLVLEFHGLRPMKDEHPNLTTPPWSTQGLDEGWEGDTFLRDDITYPRPLRVFSGYRITMETDDPDVRPLPSFELLRLQWFLQRVTGMANAVETAREMFNEDTCEGTYWSLDREKEEDEEEEDGSDDTLDFCD